MDDFISCRDCGAAVPSGQKSRHSSWHQDQDATVRKLHQVLLRAEAAIKQLDRGVQRLGTALQGHRH